MQRSREELHIQNVSNYVKESAGLRARRGGKNWVKITNSQSPEHKGIWNGKCEIFSLKSSYKSGKMFAGAWRLSQKGIMNELSVIHRTPYAGHRWSAFSWRPVSGKSEIEFYLRKLLGMVEEILSTAQLHRYLLDVPSLTIEVRYNSTKWLA